MSKNKGNVKGKRTKLNNSLPIGFVKINGRVANLLDHVKQAVYHKGLDFESIYRLVEEKVPVSELEKLGQNLKRCLVNNISFYFKDNTWFLDAKGNPNNNPFYQYLTTLGRPASFRELLTLAKENNLTENKKKEQDFAYDGRFIRLKNGKWALTHWQIIWEMGKEELQQAVRLFQIKQKPLTTKYLAKEIAQLDVADTNLDWIIAGDQRFLQLDSEHWFLQSILDGIIKDITAVDELSFMRQREINVLQEAELMLIIGEADVTKRQYILSSLDLEKGILRLNKRMVELFKKLPKIAYLKLDFDQDRIGIWYLKDQECLYGLKPWFEYHQLEAGSKLDLGFSAATLRLELRNSGEREAEVYAEGLRIKKLNSLKSRVAALILMPEEIIAEILQLYPRGIEEDNLIALAELLAGIKQKDLIDILVENFYYEQDKQGNWYCNFIMRQGFQSWQQEKAQLTALLSEVQQQVAVTVEDYEGLEKIKINLEEELRYLREHHREEEVIFRARIEELAAAKEHLTVENNHLRSENDHLEQKKKDLLEHLDYQGGQLLNLRSERNKFKVKLEQVEARAMQLQSSLNHLTEEAQIEVDRLQRGLLEKEHQLDSLQYANQELQRSLARLHEERRLLKRQYSSWPFKIALFFTTGFKGYKRSVGG
ncbi:MAG: hypothetical protein WDA53_05245 [Bacillota bacterium]